MLHRFVIIMCVNSDVVRFRKTKLQHNFHYSMLIAMLFVRFMPHNLSDQAFMIVYTLLFLYFMYMLNYLLYDIHLHNLLIYT